MEHEQQWLGFRIFEIAREEVRQIFTIFTTYKSYPVLGYGKRYIRSSKFIIHCEYGVQNFTFQNELFIAT